MRHVGVSRPVDSMMMVQYGNPFAHPTMSAKSLPRHTDRAYRDARKAEKPRGGPRARASKRETTRSSVFQPGDEPQTYKMTTEAGSSFVRHRVKPRRRKKFRPYKPNGVPFSAETTNKADFLQLEATRPKKGTKRPDNILVDAAVPFDGVSTAKDAYIYTPAPNGGDSPQRAAARAQAAKAAENAARKMKQRPRSAAPSYASSERSFVSARRASDCGPQADCCC